MSGHSKWHNIQAKKGKADAARGKIFTKLGREILIAVKAGGPDPVSNSKLKDVIAKCKAANMPNDTINNSIKKASGEGSDKVYEELKYLGETVVIIDMHNNIYTLSTKEIKKQIQEKYGKGY